LRRRGKRKPFVKKGPEHKINKYITATEVRLVGENVEPKVYTISEAMNLAKELELDLVEISPKAKPPVCKITDYNKFMYEQKKRAKEMKSKQVKIVVKEIRFTPNTDDHDFDFKAKHAENFLKEGNKLKAYVQFRGRNIVFKERGELILLKLAERLADFGVLEQMPKLEGRRMLVLFNPKKK